MNILALWQRLKSGRIGLKCRSRWTTQTETQTPRQAQPRWEVLAQIGKMTKVKEENEKKHNFFVAAGNRLHQRHLFSFGRCHRSETKLLLMINLYWAGERCHPWQDWRSCWKQRQQTLQCSRLIFTISDFYNFCLFRDLSHLLLSPQPTWSTYRWCGRWSTSSKTTIGKSSVSYHGLADISSIGVILISFLICTSRYLTFNFHLKSKSLS